MKETVEKRSELRAEMFFLAEVSDDFEVLKLPSSGEQNVEEGTKSPAVGRFGRGGSCGVDFWYPVVRSTAGLRAATGFTCAAKVDDENLEGFGVDKNVFILDIAVRDA